MKDEEILGGILESTPEHCITRDEKKEVTLQSSFDSLGFDSADTVEVIVYAEKHFGVSFTDTEAGEVRDMEGLVLLIKHYLDDINPNPQQ